MTDLGCPNRECAHGAVFHDIYTRDDPRPTCCVDDCPCGDQFRSDLADAWDRGAYAMTQYWNQVGGQRYRQPAENPYRRGEKPK